MAKHKIFTKEDGASFISERVDSYAKSEHQLSAETESELNSLLENVIAGMDAGTITHSEMVDAYMKIASPHMKDKQKMKLKVRLLKTNKPTLEFMLRKAIKMVYG